MRADRDRQTRSSHTHTTSSFDLAMLLLGRYRPLHVVGMGLGLAVVANVGLFVRISLRHVQFRFRPIVMHTFDATYNHNSPEALCGYSYSQP